jgi:hypothetical protein
MRTLIIIAIGFALLGVTVAIGRASGLSFETLRPWFTGFWTLAAAVNMYLGVAFAGYTFAAELPIFVLIAAVPVVAAYALPRLLGSKGNPSR